MKASRIMSSHLPSCWLHCTTLHSITRTGQARAQQLGFLRHADRLEDQSDHNPEDESREATPGGDGHNAQRLNAKEAEAAGVEEAALEVVLAVGHGKEADSQHAPDGAGKVHGDGVDGIVNLEAGE